MGKVIKARRPDHICYQCHMELQGSPRARPENQGRKSYEVRDKVISPIEVRCARCHRRLSRSEKYFDTSAGPIGLALGLVFFGCEMAYVSVKDAVKSVKGRAKENYYIEGNAEFEPGICPPEELSTTQLIDAPPNYEESTTIDSNKQ